MEKDVLVFGGYRRKKAQPGKLGSDIAEKRKDWNQVANLLCNRILGRDEEDETTNAECDGNTAALRYHRVTRSVAAAKKRW